MDMSGQLHASAAINPEERAANTQWIGYWRRVFSVCLNTVKRKTFSPTRESKPSSFAFQLKAQHYTD
jgi:hypothetical protein